MDSLGNIYLADYENSRIRKLSLNTGIVTTVAGSGACPLAPGPFTITICQSGYFGDGGPATSALLNYAAAVARDSAGNLFIADTINHRIRKVDAFTGVITTIAGTGTQGFSGDGGPAIEAAISDPAGIAVDSAGRVYFTDEFNGRVRMLTPSTSGKRMPTELPRRLAAPLTDR
jgi:DNA-binding beta-propeller fold protein YncE